MNHFTLTTIICTASKSTNKFTFTRDIFGIDLISLRYRIKKTYLLSLQSACTTTGEWKTEIGVALVDPNVDGIFINVGTLCTPTVASAFKQGGTESVCC